MTGEDEASLAKEREMIRYRIAFYGSTRSYHPVLAIHGWEDLGMKLHAMSKKGQWEQMAAEVPDEVVEEFSVIARYEDLATRVEARFGGITDSLTLGIPGKMPRGQARELVQDVQRIPSPFRGFPV